VKEGEMMPRKVKAVVEYTEEARHDDVKTWLERISDEEWVETMLGLGSFRVKKTLVDGTVLTLTVTAPRR
jgi:hypothetical protein